MIKKLSDFRETLVVEKTAAAEIARLDHNIQLLESLQAGDLVQYKRELYSHWAVYIGNGKIVHLSGPEERTSSSGVVLMNRTQVRIDDFLDILKDSYAYRNNSKDNEFTPLPVCDVLTRAYSKIGCQYYDLFTFNCEQFVNWCRYGISFGGDQSSSILQFGSRVTSELRNFNYYLKNLFNNSNSRRTTTTTPEPNHLTDKLLLFSLFLYRTAIVQRVVMNTLKINRRLYSTTIHDGWRAAATSKYVPKSAPVLKEDLNKLNEFVYKSKRLLLLTGAGISTESGIPDYRSEGVGLYATSKNRPVQYRDFLKSEHMRTRYWARNYIGWPIFSSFKPNRSHYIAAEWERKGKAHHHVTQNVDSLLFKAGCKEVSELHGSAYRVLCLDCDFKISRHDMQNLIKNQNPDWSAQSDVIAPDSDVQLTEEQIKGFRVPTCPKCSNNSLKPDLVFFGDNVPRSLVQFINDKVAQSDALLIIGSTIQTFSAYRIVLKAKELHIPVAILSIGQTRADDLANLKVNGRCSEALSLIEV